MQKVHGLRTDSKAYALANFTYKLYQEQGKINAEIFLRHQAKLEKLKSWELMAVADCVTGLIKDGTEYHCILCAKPSADVACQDCESFVQSLKKTG